MYLSFVFQYNLKSVKIDYVGTNYWPIVLIEVLFSKYVYKYVYSWIPYTIYHWFQNFSKHVEIV